MIIHRYEQPSQRSPNITPTLGNGHVTPITCPADTELCNNVVLMLNQRWRGAVCKHVTGIKQTHLKSVQLNVFQEIIEVNHCANIPNVGSALAQCHTFPGWPPLDRVDAAYIYFLIRCIRRLSVHSCHGYSKQNKYMPGPEALLYNEAVYTQNRKKHHTDPTLF